MMERRIVEKSVLEDAARAAALRLGYPRVKPEQLRVMVEFLSGRDAFAVLPTGFGKSLCYGVLPYAFDELEKQDKEAIVVVVSPLTAIMKDQADSFSSKGIATAYVTGEGGREGVKRAMVSGGFQLVFITPELDVLMGGFYLIQKLDYVSLHFLLQVKVSVISVVATTAHVGSWIRWKTIITSNFCQKRFPTCDYMLRFWSIYSSFCTVSSYVTARAIQNRSYQHVLLAHAFILVCGLINCGVWSISHFLPRTSLVTRPSTRVVWVWLCQTTHIPG